MKLSGKIAEKGLAAFSGEFRTQAGVSIPRLWIVVTDREKAHIYRKTPGGVERIADAKSGHAKSHPEEAGAKGAVSHGYDARSEKKHHQDSAFVQRLAAWLDMATREDAFDRLVLVAPPHALGDIRNFLSNHVRDRVVTEVDKDLMKLSDKETEDHLSKILWF